MFIYRILYTVYMNHTIGYVTLNVPKRSLNACEQNKF